MRPRPSPPPPSRLSVCRFPLHSPAWLRPYRLVCKGPYQRPLAHPCQGVQHGRGFATWGLVPRRRSAHQYKAWSCAKYSVSCEGAERVRHVRWVLLARRRGPCGANRDDANLGRVLQAVYAAQ